MSARKIRRAAEHQARKQARKDGRLQGPPSTLPTPVPVAPVDQVEEDMAPSASQAQIDANRANAQLSTGPTSEEGKAISSQNRLCHGLAGKFQIMPWEDDDAYVAMRDELIEHYDPAGIVEIGYVDRLAEHTWLRYRSLNLQTDCFDDDQTGLIQDEKQFALLLRYQNQNERGIDKCVNQLLKLQTARRKEQNGFVSEIRKEATETRKNEAHEARLRLTNARAKHIEVDSDIRQTVEMYVPGNMHTRFEELSGAFRGAIRDVSEEIQEKETAA